MSAATLWTHVPMVQMSLQLLFHLLAVHGLYFAPIYGWLMLVSGWARRAPFLWAVVPPFAIGIVERIAFNTSHFAALLGSRLSGDEGGAASAPDKAMNSMNLHAMGQFLVSPGLWIGLLVFAAFLAAAVRLRRNQGPV
jgi:ABC-2 type transport system permease protein